MLLKTDLKIKSILAAKEYYENSYELISKKNIPDLFVADKQIMQSIVGHKIHHNVMMCGIRPKPDKLENLGNHIIMLESSTSAENIGSIARSAAALGVDSFILPKSAPHPYGRRALRVSMGHISLLKTYIFDDIFLTLQTLKKDGYKIFASEVTSSSIPLKDIKVPKKWVLLMGHEDNGLSQKTIDYCDKCVQIEMDKGIKSFNVSVASAILMYKFKQNS